MLMPSTFYLAKKKTCGADGKELSINQMKRAYMDATFAWNGFHASNGGVGQRNGRRNTDKYKIGPIDSILMYVSCYYASIWASHTYYNK